MTDVYGEGVHDWKQKSNWNDWLTAKTVTILKLRVKPQYKHQRSRPDETNCGLKSLQKECAFGESLLLTSGYNQYFSHKNVWNDNVKTMWQGSGAVMNIWELSPESAAPLHFMEL